MLSKSQFLRGLQCPKSLWLQKNKPELKASSLSEESLFETGNKIGKLACQLFSGGNEIQFDPQNFTYMAEQTAALVAQGHKIIYEATFQQDDVFVMVDILVNKDDKWDIYEVKASTGVKKHHLNDAAGH